MERICNEITKMIGELTAPDARRHTSICRCELTIFSRELQEKTSERGYFPDIFSPITEKSLITTPNISIHGDVFQGEFRIRILSRNIVRLPRGASDSDDSQFRRNWQILWHTSEHSIRENLCESMAQFSSYSRADYCRRLFSLITYHSSHPFRGWVLLGFWVAPTVIFP